MVSLALDGLTVVQLRQIQAFWSPVPPFSPLQVLSSSSFIWWIVLAKFAVKPFDKHEIPWLLDSLEVFKNGENLLNVDREDSKFTQMKAHVQNCVHSRIQEYLEKYTTYKWRTGACLTFYREFFQGRFLQYPGTVALVSATGEIILTNYMESPQGEDEVLEFLSDAYRWICLARGFFYSNFVTEFDLHDERYVEIDNSIELVLSEA